MSKKDIIPSGTESTNPLDLIKSDLTVGMDDVVAYFISDYETRLYNRKDDLNKQIKQVKQDIEALDKRICGSVNKSIYEVRIAAVRIQTEVTSLTVVWSEKESHISVSLAIRDFKEDGTFLRNTNSKTLSASIVQNDIDLHWSLMKEKNGYETDLGEVMVAIKNVSRKERQVRGKISEMKLAQSGLSELLNNAELTKLIQLDSPTKE